MSNAQFAIVGLAADVAEETLSLDPAYNGAQKAVQGAALQTPFPRPRVSGGRMSHAPVARSVANEANEERSMRDSADDYSELRGAAKRAGGQGERADYPD